MMEQYIRSLGGVIFLRKFDLFSQPFYHRVDYNQKTKKTALGGFISLCIILLSLAYLIYILYLFFSDSYTPSITQMQTTQEGLTTHTLTFSPFAFTFRSGGTVYSDWQTYFDVYMYLDNNGNGIDSVNHFKIKKCKDVLPEFPNLESHFCIDTSNTPEIVLQTNQSSPADDLLFNFALFIKNGCNGGACDPSALLKKPNFVMEFAFIYQRYFTDEQKLKLVMQRENVILDPAVFAQDIYQVQQTKASIDNGFLLSSWTYQSYVSDFKKSQSYITQATKNVRFAAWSHGADLLRLSQIQLTDSIIEMNIQFPKISIVLAQFQSIFSTLLIVGIIAKAGSENKNVEENIDIIMNNYYKRSALEIDDFLEQQKQSKQKNKKNNVNQIQAEPRENQSVKQRAEIKNRLFNLYQYKLLKHYYTDGKKIKDDEKDPQVKGFKKALQKSWSLMNAHQMHLEILKTKTALQLILNEKQYAALEFVGRRLYPNENELNHLEALEKIDDDYDLRIKKAQEYYDELKQTDIPKDPIDQKFKNAILKQIFEPPKQRIDEEQHGFIPKDEKHVKEMYTFNLENQGNEQVS